MTTEMSWLVKIFPEWQYKLRAFNTVTELPQFCDDEKSSVQFPSAVLAIILQFGLKVCDENSEVCGSNSVPSLMLDRVA
jgi:hypothetical protein